MLNIDEIEQRLIAGDTELRDKILNDLVFWSSNFSTIVDEDANDVRFVPRPAQLKVEKAKMAQRAAGRPVRIIKLKARRGGSSVWDVNELVQKCTTRKNRRALIVAQDNDTASELFGVGEVIYDNLPERPWIKPPLRHRRNSTGGEKMMHWGEPSTAERSKGRRGLDSILKIGTAQEVEAGRGKRITDLHCTEAAFWPDPRKVLSLMSTVFERPDTSIVIESTANGFNTFKTRWDNAVSGRGGFVAVFISWLEDPNLVRPFGSEEAREKFIAEEYGKDIYGEDEPALREKGASWEQLHWRRNAIFDKADGDLSKFKQEYPSTPLEAFVGSGKHVFSISLIEKAEEEAKLWNPPPVLPSMCGPDGEEPGDGLLVAADWKPRPLAYGTMEVPTGSLWLPESIDTDPDKPRWRVWQHPEKGGEGVRPGNYIIGVDVALGEEMTSSGDSDYHAIQVIDHSTGDQCAEWRGRIDRDLLALEVFLAGLYFNEALLAPEITGGFGASVVEDLKKKYAYRRIYRPREVGARRERQANPYGFHTSRKTKPAMEDRMAELLREGAEHPSDQVIRSMNLINEFKTYVRHTNGSHAADTDQFDDLLMAFLIAQRVRQLERPPVALTGSPATPTEPAKTPAKTNRYGRPV